MYIFLLVFVYSNFGKYPLLTTCMELFPSFYLLVFTYSDIGHMGLFVLGFKILAHAPQ